MAHEACDGIDFNALIDGVIDRQSRTNFTLFLWGYEFEEAGKRRKLVPSEIRLIRAIVDGFLLDDSFASLGFVELENLQERLSVLAATEQDFLGKDAVRVRNACFDAMVCNKALEARLAKERDANMIFRESICT